MLIKHSMGALATDKAFLTAKSRRLRVRSARRPTAKVAVASERPMMVRYWRCHPYESLLCAGGRDEDPHMPSADNVGDLHSIGMEDEVGEGVGEGGETERLQ